MRDLWAATDDRRLGPTWEDNLVNAPFSQRLWAACVDATVSYTRAADETYVVGLARRAGIERQVASQLLARFDELGVFGWKSARRGSHTPGLLTLPSGARSADDAIEDYLAEANTVAGRKYTARRVGPAVG